MLFGWFHRSFMGFAMVWGWFSLIFFVGLDNWWVGLFRVGLGPQVGISFFFEFV